MRHKIIADMARVVSLAYPGCVLVPFQTEMTHSNPTCLMYCLAHGVLFAPKSFL